MSPTKTKPKTESKPAAKAAPKEPKALDYDAIRAKIAEQVAPHQSGDVNAPHVVAYEALNYFDTNRYHNWFQTILEAAAKS